MKRTDELTPPTRRRLLAGLGVRVAIVAAVVAAVAVAGFGAAGDDVLARRYYDLRGQRDSGQRVLLVAFDAPALAAWGPPPWPVARIAPVLAAVQRGAPIAVGVVEDPARVIAAAGGSGLPTDEPADVIVGRAELALDRDAVTAAVLRDANGATTTARLAAAAGRARGESRLAINFIGRRGLPTVSALDVARGSIPSASFAGKLVVLGLTAQPQAGLVPTPVGPLAPAQVQAHALASVLDDVAWRPVAGAARWALIVALALAAMLCVRRLGTLGATAAVTALAAGVVIADYALFAGGSRLGATLPVLGVLVATAVERIYERLVLRRDVEDIALWTRQWLALDSLRTEVPDDEPGYWRRVAGLARLYLGCSATIVAELPAGATHLKLRVINGTTAEHIADRRRDVRRSPYRKAHLTLGPVWHDRFMGDAATATLLVPLVVRRRLVGFWILNFAHRDIVAAPHMALIKTLAREIAMAIDRRQLQGAALRPSGRIGGLVSRLLGGGRFSVDLDEVRRSFQAHTQNQQDLRTLGESLPYGVCVATLWGDLRFVNPAMKLVWKDAGVDPATATSLPEVMVQLTGFELAEVHRHLRKLVQELEEMHIRGRGGRDLVLSWLKPRASDPADAEQLIVVSVVPSRRAAAVAATAMPATPPATPPATLPIDDGAVTALRPRHALDDLLADDAGPAGRLAHGTPRFSTTSAAAARLAPHLPLAPLGPPTPPLGAPVVHVPDATLQLRNPDLLRGIPADEPEAVTFVIAGSGARSSRGLPVVPDSFAGDATLPRSKHKL